MTAAGHREGIRARWLNQLMRTVPLGADGAAQILGRHIYILPTGPGVLLGAVLLLMLLGSLNYQNNLGLFLTFLMGSVALVAMHHTWFNLLHLRVETRGGPPVFVGEQALFTVTLTDPGIRARSDLCLPGDDDKARIGRGGSAQLELRLNTERRGWRYLKRVDVETRYPLGLFRAWSRAQVHAQVLVYPGPAARGPEPPLLPAVGESNVGDLGVGADDFVGPRTYRPGDSPRHLDWKALARERGLVVKQFGGDQSAQVWLDMATLPSADLETRLGLLCRQVLDAAEAGLSYGLRLPGQSIPLGRGDAHRHRCLEALATFDHG